MNTARAHLADQPALLLHEDFTESPDEWLDADVVLAVSTCFDRDQMNKLSMLTQRLRRKGARFITIDKPLLCQGSSLSLAVTVKCFGDWGSALGRVYVQTTSQRKRTARQYSLATTRTMS